MQMLVCAAPAPVGTWVTVVSAAVEASVPATSLQESTVTNCCDFFVGVAVGDALLSVLVAELPDPPHAAKTAAKTAATVRVSATRLQPARLIATRSLASACLWC